jgi:hypothetical protein
LKIAILRKYIRNALKDLKFGAGVEWRRSVGPIMWKMKKYYKELRRKRTSCVK